MLLRARAASSCRPSAAIGVTIALLLPLDTWEAEHTARYPDGVDLIPRRIPSDLILRGEWEENARRTAEQIGLWTIAIAVAAIAIATALEVRRRRGVAAASGPAAAARDQSTRVLGSVRTMASPFIELEVGERVVKLTNPDKVLFPKARKTKRDLAEYYIAVGEGIVRALYERPTQLRRFPDGVTGEMIYQKRVPEKRPEWVESARVTFPSGRHADELCVTELASVIWAANLAVVDFHPWPSRRRDTEHPDELRIDIDPQPGTTFRDGKRVAALVREVLAEIGYTGWPKTSGNRGIHVFCRIEPNWEFPVVRRAALAFAREVERRLPKKVTTAWWKEERGKRVFIDYNQNARDRTVASAYSVRGRPDATVSAPVTWDELPDVDTEDFSMATMPARFAAIGDVHAGIDDAVCDLRVLLEWVERDEKGGLAEAPYPPNFPKMPGEPPRVQPSRARKPRSRLAREATRWSPRSGPAAAALATCTAPRPCRRETG